MPYATTSKSSSPLEVDDDPTSLACKKQRRKRTARILVLHGFAESGDHIRAKTRFLRSLLSNDLARALPFSSLADFHSDYPDGFEFVYPTGPARLLRADDESMENLDASSNSASIELFAWGVGDYTSTTKEGEIQHLDESVRRMLQLLVGGPAFVGIVGFSTGATLALILACIAERPELSELFCKLDDPAKLLKLKPFRFGIMYSGCILSHPRYERFFSTCPPMIRLNAPVLHFVGEYDTMLPREEMLKFSVRACGGNKDSLTVFHEGGHFVAQYRECRARVVEFVAAVLVKGRHV
ncbi:Serine hydrolase FSH [Rhypophila sp. PSN 637]